MMILPIHVPFIVSCISVFGKMWRMVGEREVLAIPRAAVLRAIMLNHWHHHRGQLSVYLRELGIPIPSIDGNSADENPLP